MNTDVVNVTQLAVLASLVDGQASQQEIDTIAKSVSERFDISEADIKTLAEKLVATHTKKNLNRHPVAIVRLGVRSLQNLTGRNKRIAMQIAKDVAEASDGVDANEAMFLQELASFAK